MDRLAAVAGAQLVEGGFKALLFLGVGASHDITPPGTVAVLEHPPINHPGPPVQADSP